MLKMHTLETDFVVFKARGINLTAILLCVTYCEKQLTGVEEMEVDVSHIELVRTVGSICVKILIKGTADFLSCLAVHSSDK
jgi:hypothetical protein